MRSEQRTSVGHVYFDLAARAEHSGASVLGSLLKQLISGIETTPEEIWRALQEQRKAISGLKSRLVDLVRMLQLISPRSAHLGQLTLSANVRLPGDLRFLVH